MFYIKRAKKLSTIFSFCFNLVFWTLSDYCIYIILGANKYIYAQTLEWETIVFGITSIISLSKILQNISELKEKVNNNYEKSNIPYGIDINLRNIRPYDKN